MIAGKSYKYYKTFMWEDRYATCITMSDVIEIFSRSLLSQSLCNVVVQVYDNMLNGSKRGEKI